LILLLIIIVVDLLVVSYFVVPSVQKVYFDPRLRWWEAAPRYHFDQEGQVNGSQAYLKNLGQGGLFMTTGPDLSEGDRADIFWSFEGQEVRIPGKVVYKSLNPNFPGYGVKFDPHPEGEKKVAQVIATLHRRGKIVAERLPGPEDSFGVWFKKLLTSGEGLFPRVGGRK
jgi:Tfp pilus assembly protein PilZ